MEDLRLKLMKALSDASYKIEGPADYITFCSYKYMDALAQGAAYTIIDSNMSDPRLTEDDISDPINNSFKMNLYIGLNGDKNQIIFLPHEDTDNITIYVNTNGID